MSGYRGLVERRFTVLAEEEFGDYQGDILFVVLDPQTNQLGVIVTGYGSCSGCDAYQAAEDSAAELNELAAELHRSVHHGTVPELREYLVGRDGELRWSFHEGGFAEAVDKALGAAEAARFTVTFTGSGQGVGHAARTTLFPLCGTNINKPHAGPQIQAQDWSAVTCKRCLAAIAAEEKAGA